MKEEYSYHLTKSTSSSVASNSVTKPVADPAIVTTLDDSLGLSTDHDRFAKRKRRPPARSQCSLKLRSACDSEPSKSVTEPVADPTVMAIRVDILDCAAEHTRSAKPKHSLPASNQRSLENAEDLLQ